jgi:hypothetical protein
MSTLKTQYEKYLKQNPLSILTYDEWMEQIWTPTVLNFSQMGSDDISDWDNTLLDGLEDED